MKSNNAKKDALLGEPHGTAANRLRKMLMFKYVKEARMDLCYRCRRPIETVADLSIEHKSPWQSAPDPREAFFNLADIVFSHLQCKDGVRQR